MASGSPSAQVRIPIGDLFFFTYPLMLTLYYWGKNYPVAKKLCGGRIVIRRRNNYPGRVRLDQKFDKRKSHSAEKTLFLCGTVPYPLPKTERYRLYITEAVAYPNTLPSYLNTLTHLYPILIHCRI